MHGRAALLPSPPAPHPECGVPVHPSSIESHPVIRRRPEPRSSEPKRFMSRQFRAKQVRAMARLATISLLLSSLLPATVNPAVAQVGTPNGQQGVTGGAQSSAQGGGQAGGQGGPSGSGLDVICNQLIAGTFCSSGGSGSGGYGSFSAGTSANDPSLPPCASGMPANELCN
jgi:hypothetical protein